MVEKRIALANQILSISFPGQAAEIVEFTFRNAANSHAKATLPPIEIRCNTQRSSFTLTVGGTYAGNNLSPTDLSLLLSSRSQYAFARSISTGLTIHAAAVVKKNKAILVCGTSATDKSILTCWLLSKGYTYLSDSLIHFPGEGISLNGIACPIHLKSNARQIVESFCSLENISISSLQDGDTTLLSFAAVDTISSPTKPELACILFAEQSDDNTWPTVTSISPALSTKKLMEFVAGRLPAGLHSFRQLSSLTRKTPAILFQYQEFESLDTVLQPILDLCLKTSCSAGTFSTALKTLQNHSQLQHTANSRSTISPQIFPIPDATKPGKKRKLTIGMTCYDDFDGAYFTIQALQMYHAEAMKDCEILLIDNHPDGPCSKSLKKLDQQIDGYRYIPLPWVQGTSVRNHIFHHAAGDYVLCLDCHVLLSPGAIANLLTYFTKNPDCNDLLQGPMLNNDLQTCTTHMNPTWQDGMYGTWSTDPRGERLEAEPFEIPMQGLGLFACRKDAWLWFNPRFRGFGGEEGYIHEKFRQAGNKTLCLPFLRWLHRFERPMGVPYPVKWEDRIWNYSLGLEELQLSADAMQNHFQTLLGKETADRVFLQTKNEMASPFHFFDSIYCITLSTDSDRWQKMQQRFRALGIAKHVRPFIAIATPDSHHIGGTLSHREIIAAAKRERLQNVLIFEDDTIFLDTTVENITKSIAELKTEKWNLFYLGAHTWGKEFKYADNCSHLLQAHGITCTHALAYNHTVYDQILEYLPDSIDKMREWVRSNFAIAPYLRTVPDALLACPVVAFQQGRPSQENPIHQHRFTLGDQHNLL